MTGSGTQGDPFIIENVTDLQAMENNLSAYYELGGDIDASATSGWNAGEGFIPIGISAAFTGHLDGKDYTISDLVINNVALGRRALIRIIDDGATLSNIKMTNVSVTGRWQVAALVGLMDNTSACAVSNCSSTGTITGGDAIGEVGGLIGKILLGTVSVCWSSCTVICPVDYGGGLIGHAGGGSIDDCYARGGVTVTGDGGGGFVGFNEGAIIDDCYSTGAASAATNEGGFCGRNSATITNCFWDTETSGNATSSGGTGKTTSQMKAQATFTDAGWDFTTPIWYISSDINNGYPFLEEVQLAYPSDAVARVSSIRHIFRPGFFRMQVGLGDIGLDVDIAESTVRKALDTAKEVEEAIAEAAPAVEEPYPYTPIEVMQPLYEAEAARRAAEAPTVIREGVERKIVTPTAETIRILVEESDKIAILQEIGRLSRSASAAGLTPYARDVLQRAIKRKQDELDALYRSSR